MISAARMKFELALKNNKMTVEEEQQDINFENFVLIFERKACRQKLLSK